MQKRLISTLIAAPIAIFAICWNVWSYFLLFFLITMVAMAEFYKLAALYNTTPLKLWGVLSGLVIYSCIFSYIQGYLALKYLYILPLLIIATYIIKLYKKNDPIPFSSIAYTLLAIIYISMPFSMLHLLAFLKGYYAYELVLGILFILWAFDTGAYIVGSIAGKHKLFQRLSPKKSWEGMAGGTILALGVSLMVAYYFKNLPLWQWLAIAAIIVVTGTYGDLVESMFKRTINIKDSGTIMPGHGGLLDRFDSFLLAMPCILAFIKIIS